MQPTPPPAKPSLPAATVDAYIARAGARLSARTRAQALARARALGLL